MFSSDSDGVLGPSSLSSQWALGILASIGGILVGALLLDVYVDWVHQGDPLWSTLVENAVPVLLALGLPYVGWRLHRAHDAPTYLAEGARWSLLGAAGLILLSGLVIGVQILQQEIKLYVLVLHGAVLGAVGGLVIGLSIARVRASEQKIQAERDRLKNLFEGLPAPVVHGTFEGDRLIVSAVNRAFEDIFGQSASEIEGEDLYGLVVPGGEREEAGEIDRRALEHGPVEEEVRRLTADGPRDFQLRVAPALNHGAAETYAVYTDITERKRKEQVAKRRSDAMDAASDGIAILDSEGIYTYVNQAHADIYGYDSPEAFLGETWRICYRGKDLRRFEEEVMPTLYAEGRWRGRATGHRADGSRFPQELTLSLLDEGGLVCVVRDITDRKEREKELRDARERMELALKHTGSVVFEIDLETRDVTRHGVFEDFFNASPEDVPTWDVFAEQVAHPADRKKFMEFYRRLEEGRQKSGVLEYRTNPETGTVRWIRDIVFVEEGPLDGSGVSLRT